ncbi:MarR family transcriptional regulator [Jatrophihabitans telluris]|uniref:MarR family transcriptional regulator n=1 Tax=Jatrophihabitans telluris TaxID=2038343 RepID=A0ABY4R090_9ACTN|nr:MarR family transcriptional regulator [Jatrophihabitans telluris]UQX89125.1 MarR family transcriptional regulator [Jatrophihabitans telluris]
MTAPSRVADAALASTIRLSILRVARRLRSQRADTAVTLSQLSALATVNKNGPLSAGEVAAIEQVQPPSMTKILAALEGAGLIERAAHPDDRRQSIISISEAGQNLLADEIRLRDEWLARRLAELSAADREKLLQAAEVLDRLASE